MCIRDRGITNRIGVMSNGHLSGIVNTKETNQEELLRLSAKYQMCIRDRCNGGQAEQQADGGSDAAVIFLKITVQALQLSLIHI